MCAYVQAALSCVCAHVFTCEWLAMCLVAPHFVCLLVCTHLGSRCRGRGVLAHTSKQHHELLLPAYLKIETAEETRPHRALGEGWVEGGRGMAQSPCPALSLSLYLPLAQRSYQGYLWGPDAAWSLTQGGRDKWVTECAAYLPIPFSGNDGSAGGCQVLGRGVWRAPLCSPPTVSSRIWRDFTPRVCIPFPRHSN